MTNIKSIEKFAENINQEVINLCDIDGEESFREDKFIELYIDYLNEAGELEDVFISSYRSRGVQANGYSISEDQECFDLIVTIYNGDEKPERILKQDINAVLKRAKNFILKSFKELYTSLEESSDVFDMAKCMFDVKNKLSRIRIFLLTDGIVNIEFIDDEVIENIDVTYHIWDIERLFRCWSSGQKRESIEINFKEEFNKCIPCLCMPDLNEDYICYLAIIPGEVLYKIYADYGARLLERNVRSFLQAKGNVNKGIKNTILKESHMFLAYNNGISATAESVEIQDIASGGKGIRYVKDFQIVNGGQTTASIYNAAKKNKADLSNVFVQVKLTVLKNSSKMDEFVPKISEYANSQNKVQIADFSANDPFHMKIEGLSRTIWAPAKDGSQRQSRWFYERARGQYNDAKSRVNTKSQLKKFEAEQPKKQVFTKTDLSKFENTWNQKPHLVSKGAQTNFKHFTVELKERGGYNPDEMYFKHLIAKAILFRRTEKLVQEQKYGGYRANIVTYTLAWIFHETAQRIDLDKIWREQKLSIDLENMIVETSKKVLEHIKNAPNGGNVTQWCKKEACWKSLLEKNKLEISKALAEELIAYGKQKTFYGNRSVDTADAKELELIKEIVKVSSETWFALSAWAKETNNLQVWQRSIAYSIGRCVAKDKQPSRKQALQAKRIIEEAEQLGFKITKVV